MWLLTVCGSVADLPPFLRVRTSVCAHVCVAGLLEQAWSWRVPASAALVLPLRSDVQPIPWLSSSHKEPAYVCGGGCRRGRRVIADYCYSSRHFISSEISISPPYWACYGTDLPPHTMFPLSTSDDQTAGPQMLLLSKKLVKAPWDDAFHFWHFPLPRDETGLLWSALDQEERNWAVVSAPLASKQTVFQIWLGLINYWFCFTAGLILFQKVWEWDFKVWREERGAGEGGERERGVWSVWVYGCVRGLWFGGMGELMLTQSQMSRGETYRGCDWVQAAKSSCDNKRKHIWGRSKEALQRSRHVHLPNLSYMLCVSAVSCVKLMLDFKAEKEIR